MRRSGRERQENPFFDDIETHVNPPRGKKENEHVELSQTKLQQILLHLGKYSLRQ